MSRWFWVVVLISASGCSNGMHPVKGKVHFADGTPLVTGRVVVVTTGTSGTWGLIHPDGTFTLGTLAPNDGVQPGEYRVIIQNAVSAPPPGFLGNFVPEQYIHPRFGDPEDSGLKFEVPKQMFWDITVEKP